MRQATDEVFYWGFLWMNLPREASSQIEMDCQ
jgi:hypothetical protein